MAISRKGPMVKIDGRFTSAAYCTLLKQQVIICALNGPHPNVYSFFQQDLSPVHTSEDKAHLLEDRG